jgi:hypothetical protein
MPQKSSETIPGGGQVGCRNNKGRFELTRHVGAVGEEVGRVRDQDDEAALRLGIAADVRELEEQGGCHAHKHADELTSEEDDQEDTETFKEAEEAELSGVDLVSLCGLEDNDSDGVIEDRFAKDDGVQLGIDLVGVEDGQDGHRVGGGQGGADGDGIDKVHLK